jgi:hypothetical protein
MADTTFILYKPKIKSSVGNTTDIDVDSILCDIDTICSQCGHDHSCKMMGGKAIQDMISFLDRGTT